VRRRILLLVVGLMTLVVLAFAVPLAVLIRHVVYQDATKSLQDTANRVAFYLRDPNGSPTTAQITSTVRSLSHNRKVSVQLPDGTVVGSKPPGGSPTFSFQFGSAGQGPSGNPDVPGGGRLQPELRSWHGGQLAQQAVGGRSGLYVVRVWASQGQLHSGETGWWLLLGGVSIGLLLVGIAAAEVLTRRIVRPLLRTAQTAQLLSVGEAGARAPVRGPREVSAVGVALNGLADRIDELIAEERETVADLSHRLRTPLTALRLDAEALRNPDEAERMSRHAGTLERMLTAMIHAARRTQREGRMPSCDATEVVGERVQFWSVLAEDQARTVTVALPDAALPVRASAEDLAAALDALIENVIAHTPEGTAFAVTLAGADDATVRLEVSDDGPGLVASEVVRGRSDRGSSGLGLDIARRFAQAAGGSMTIGRSAAGGAAITLFFARAQATRPAPRGR
jgi:signal transduction histidine kinase